MIVIDKMTARAPSSCKTLARLDILGVRTVENEQYDARYRENAVNSI
jgi:hypothetical protein